MIHWKRAKYMADRYMGMHFRHDTGTIRAPALCDSCLIGHSPLVARLPPPAPAADEWQRITDEDTVTHSTFSQQGEGPERVWVQGGGGGGAVPRVTGG
ncbi:hypothetical protein MHYP_G00201120 [Metynnis hypsauchen]